ncbi:MAG TPA: ECF-type sigma factor [Phycisphaerae bacterium]
MNPVAPEHVTRLLQQVPDDRAAADELFTLVYDQLRRIAQQHMKQERREHTLGATALVHEVWLRLAGDREVPWQDRAHFFLAAAEGMRRILIDHARSRGRLKRGGDAEGRPARRVPIQLLDLADAEQDPEEILMLDEALRRLEEQDAEAARIVRLRFFAGMSGDAVAAALGVSPSTVDREWAYARARLYRLMRELGAG